MALESRFLGSSGEFVATEVWGVCVSGKNIGDLSRMPSVPIDEGVYVGEAVLDSCGDFNDGHSGLGIIPIAKIFSA